MKDSGERTQFDSGMVRDTTEGKINFMLIRPGPMFRRWAAHLSRAAAKYDNTRKPGEPRNWQLAEGMAEFERFLESAARHFEQYLERAQALAREETPDPDGYDEDGNPIYEDHAAGLFFNVNGAEYVLEQMTERPRGKRVVKGVVNSFVTPSRVILYDTGEACPVQGCRVPGFHEGDHVLA